MKKTKMELGSTNLVNMLMERGIVVQPYVSYDFLVWLCYLLRNRTLSIPAIIECLAPHSISIMDLRGESYKKIILTSGNIKNKDDVTNILSSINNRAKSLGVKPDFSVIWKIYGYTKGDIPTAVFTSESNNVTVVLTHNYNPVGVIENNLYLIPLIMPSITENVPLTDEELSVLKSADLVTRNKALSESDTITEVANSEAEAWCDSYRNNRLDSLSRQISEAENTIRNTAHNLKNLISEVAGKRQELNALEQCVRDNELAKVFEYLEKNTSITGYKVEGENLVVTVMSPLEYFDPQIVRALIANDELSVYQGRTADEILFIKKLLEDILLGEYRLNLRSCFYVQPPRYVGLKAECIPNFEASSLANPHHKFYSCLGSYESEMTDALIAGNIIEAIEICVASTKEINFYDLAVTDRFLSNLVSMSECRNKSCKCLVGKDGVNISINELADKIRNGTEEE